jgi:site-specific recombinase XerD
LQDLKESVEKSVSKSTWNVYENAIQSFERFRNQFGIEHIWSPPIDHLTNYIAFLSMKGYSSATAKSCISGIRYKVKINNLEDRN